MTGNMTEQGKNILDSASPIITSIVDESDIDIDSDDEQRISTTPWQRRN